MSELKENDIKIVIYGCGVMGRELAEYFPNDYDFPKILAFIDKNIKGKYMGIPILAPEQLKGLKFDYVIIACIRLDAYNEIKNTLLSDLKIDKSKIIDMGRLVFSSKIKSRTNFLKDFARLCRQMNMSGSVAEAGVHRGDFAKFINIYFSDRKLYLFDTFEGFDEEDLKIEKSLGMSGFIEGLFCDNKELFSNTGIELVQEKMMNTENVIIKQGIFPDTAVDITDVFCFVNLDMDLYMPTLNGLKFFWNRMVIGGCILVHDYFHEQLPGVKKAIDDFEQEIGIKLNRVPIGDGCSIAIIKS